MLDIRESSAGLFVIGGLAAGVGFILTQQFLLPMVDNLTNRGVS